MYFVVRSPQGALSRIDSSAGFDRGKRSDPLRLSDREPVGELCGL